MGKWDWLSGEVKYPIITDHVNAARNVLKGRSEEDCKKLWGGIEKILTDWINENAPYTNADYGLASVDERGFKMPVSLSDRLRRCADLIFAMCLRENSPMYALARAKGLQQVMSVTILHFADAGRIEEVDRAASWLHRSIAAKSNKRSFLGAEAKNKAVRKAKEFCQHVAENTWNEEHDDSVYTSKNGMLDYLKRHLQAAGYKPYTNRVIWGWIKDLAPDDVTKPGRR